MRSTEAGRASTDAGTGGRSSGAKRVLLIYPHPASQPPGGIAAIAPVFSRHGYEVRTIVNTFDAYLDTRDIMAVAERFRPDIVGLSFITFRLLGTYELMRQLKRLGPLVLAGGVHPTIRPEESLSNGADIVVLGEGDDTVEELCTHWTDEGPESLDRIAGLCFRRADGSLVRTSPRPRITDPRRLPIPDIHVYDLDRFRMPDGTIKAGNKIFVSRGCPFQCTFCDRAVFGSRSVSLPPEKVIEQIERLQSEFGYTEFVFDDDNFLLNKQNAREICERIIEKGLAIRWLVASHVNTADRELLALAKKAGCFQIVYGAESGDDDTLRRVRKGYTRADILDVVRMTHEVGLKIYVNLMTGFPWETPAHVENTIDLIKRIAPMVYAFQCYGAVVPYPNTPIYDEYADQAGFRDWWLKPRYQNAGMVIFQNVEDPFGVSSYFQRNLYDDTYVYEDYFFRFTSQYKKKVKEMLFLLGRHNLGARYSSRWRLEMAYALGRASRTLYEIDPRIERKIVSFFHPRNAVHHVRGVATFVKK